MNKPANPHPAISVLKLDVLENSTFPFARALGSALPHTACPSDFAVLKSDAAENSTFPSARALGSVSPHTACPSDSALSKELRISSKQSSNAFTTTGSNCVPEPCFIMFKASFKSILFL